MEGPAVNVGGEAAPETVVVELAFKGSNEENEIETLDEFLTKVDGNEPASLDLSGWVFQAVDFSTLPAEQFLQFNFSRASLWGCVLPDGVNPNMLRAQGAVVLENPLDVPFKAFRGFMYRQEELAKDDAAIYQWYLQHGKELQPLFAMTTHDYSIKDALYDYLEGKTVVSIMGGHGMSRSSDIYCNVTKLAWRLAREGFLMVTGGGPGAMEAANMGAYLKNRPEEEVNEALAIIATGNGVVPPSKEFTNVQPALSVIERFGPTTYMPSIGIPTWRYGHEPSNVFATFHAKMFSNAVREDGIIAVSNGGIIFTPGSAGTRQEIFQDACYNHYSSEAECCPMVFYPAAFWKENGVFDLLKNTSVSVVLGAFGCGVHGNPPKHIAQLFGEVLRKDFAGRFEMVVFAIIDGSNTFQWFNPQGNVLPFAQAFKCEALTLEELAERIAKDDNIQPSDNKPPVAPPTTVESVDDTVPASERGGKNRRRRAAGKGSTKTRPQTNGKHSHSSEEGP